MIPVCEPTIGRKELKYVKDCVKTNWISSKGKYIKKFEEEFAKFCNTRYAVACSSGLAAMHLALASLGLKKGDEVIVPDFTMIATSNAVLYTGAKPVFVDAEKETWNIDISKIEEKIINRTKAIMPVHIYGHPVDMDPVLDLAKKYNLFIIEDAAEATGAEYKGRKAGSLSDVGCFSLYANKIITAGEGGMVTTDNEEVAKKARILKDHALTEKRFLHEDIGFNYRMTNIQAAIGLAQMEKADKLVQARIDHANLYNELLKNVQGIILPPKKEWVKNVYWMYGVLVEDDFGINRDELRRRLLEKGIDTRTFFIPMHQQPIYKKLNLVDLKEEFPVSEELSRKGLYLPSGSSLTDKQIKQVCEALISLKK